MRKSILFIFIFFFLVGVVSAANFFNLSNGRKAEIKVMPETASEKAIERLGELNFSVELKEVGQDNMINPLKVAYEVIGEKKEGF